MQALGAEVVSAMAMRTCKLLTHRLVEQVNGQLAEAGVPLRLSPATPVIVPSDSSGDRVVGDLP
jgi:hypothetical protein